MHSLVLELCSEPWSDVVSEVELTLPLWRCFVVLTEDTGGRRTWEERLGGGGREESEQGRVLVVMQLDRIGGCSEVSTAPQKVVGITV